MKNSGETLELVAPERPDTNAALQVWTPMVTMEEVRYDDDSPWSWIADGYGNYLARVTFPDYGNDPINWSSGNGTVLKTMDLPGTLEIMIYPNPARDIVTIRLSGKCETGTATIYDSAGRMVMSRNLTMLSHLDIRFLTAGVYIYQIDSEDEVSRGKLIIE